jgi:hypothetical protein
VNIDVDQSDFEAKWYGKQIADVLTECGFSAYLRPWPRAFQQKL